MDLHTPELNKSEYGPKDIGFDSLYQVMKEFHYLESNVLLLQISLESPFKVCSQNCVHFLHYDSDHKAFKIVVFWYVTMCSRVENTSILEEHIAPFFRVEIILAPLIWILKTKAVCFSDIQGFPVSQPGTCTFGNPQNLNNTAFLWTFWQLHRLGPILCHVNAAWLWIVNYRRCVTGNGRDVL